MTLKMTLCTKDDLCEALKLQKRQQYEEERKNRIFNAKQRLYGIDLAGLEKQIIERKKLNSDQVECEKRYEEQEQLQKRLIMAKEKELEKVTRTMNSDLNYYRCKYQRNDQRREYDLNDPNSLRKSKPMRIADDDITLGVSSAQIFSGEDLYNLERKTRQREQQRAWLDQQVLERKQAEEARRKADNLFQDNITCREKHLEEMARSDYVMRQQIIHKNRQYNMKLAHQKQQARARAKQEKHEDDMAEIYNMLSSDMLSENRNAGQSATNPNKKVANMYRGMSDEELKAFRRAQEAQLVDLRQRKTEEQLMEKQWEQYAINMDRELILKEIEMERKRLEHVDDLMRTNGKIALEQDKRRKEQRPTGPVIFDEFYDQFNKTSR